MNHPLRMDPIEHRLRKRIDTITDQRNQARDLNERLTAENQVLRRRLALTGAHDRVFAYGSEAERVAARRLTWRESKRRKRDELTVTHSHPPDGAGR